MRALVGPVCLSGVLLMHASGLAQAGETTAPAEAPEAETPPAPSQPAPPAPPSPEPDGAAESTKAGGEQPAASPAPADEAPSAPAQTAAAPTTSEDRAPATGMFFSIRMPIGETFVRSFLGPQRAQNQTLEARQAGPRGVYDIPFVNSTFYAFSGWRTDDFTLGMGFGFYAYDWVVTTLCTDPATGDKMACQGIPDKTADGHIFQFAPAVMLPFFKSADLTTEVYGTGAFVLTWGPDISPQYDAFDVGGGEYIEPDIQATALGLGGSLGFGGQHFFHPNFALGAESGIFYQQLTVDPDVTLDGNDLSAPKQEGWFLGGYAALTVSFIMGA